MQRSFSLDALPDKQLLVDTERLAERWRAVDAELTAHIAEVERRGLHRDEGFSSMYAYVTEALGLSESPHIGASEPPAWRGTIRRYSNTSRLESRPCRPFASWPRIATKPTSTS